MDRDELIKEIKEAAGTFSEEELQEVEKTLLGLRKEQYRKESEEMILPYCYRRSRENPHDFTIRLPEKEGSRLLPVTGVWFLSETDYERMKNIIPRAGTSWWLGSNNFGIPVACLEGTEVFVTGINGSNRFRDRIQFRIGGELKEFCGGIRLRPVLILSDAKACGLSGGDRFFIGEEEFLVLSRRLALCVRSVGPEIYAFSKAADLMNEWYEIMIRNDSEEA